MKQTSDSVKLSGLLANLCREKNWEARLRLHGVFSFWTEVVGREIAAKARPELIRGRVLWVRVTDSVWMQQLHLEKMLLLERLNARLGEEKLEDIRFQIENRRTQPPEKKEAAPRPVGPVDAKRLAAFEQLVASIEDEPLRKALKRLWTKFEGSRYRRD